MRLRTFRIRYGACTTRIACRVRSCAVFCETVKTLTLKLNSHVLLACVLYFDENAGV